MDIVQKVAWLLLLTSMCIGVGSFYCLHHKHKWFEFLAFKQFIVVVLLAAFILIANSVMRG